MIYENHEYTLCLFCQLLHKVTSKADEINEAIENVRKEIQEIKRGERQEINATGVVASEKTSEVMCRVEVLEEKIAAVENKIDENECYKTKKWRQEKTLCKMQRCCH